MNHFYFMALNVLAGAAAVLLAERALRRWAPRRRILAAAGSFPVLAVLTLQGVGVLGYLRPAPATAVVGVLALAALLLWRRPAPHAGLPLPPASAEDGQAVRTAIALALLGGLGGFLALQTMMGVRLTSDDMSYHGPTAVHWLVNGELTLTPPCYSAHYPLNSELLATWFMLPYGSDATVSLTGLYWAMMACGAVYCLGRSIGATRPAALLCAGLLFACPAFLANARTFCAGDIAGAAMLLSAAAMATRGADESGPVGGANLFYAGLFAGFAAGTKFSYLLPCLVLLAFVATAQPLGRGLAGRGKAMAVWLAGAVPAGGFWYLRNLVLTGNPVFPAQVAFLAGPFGPREQRQTSLAGQLLGPGGDWGQWKQVLWGHMDWPLGLFLLWAVGCAWGLWASCKARARSQPTILLLVLATAMLAAYPFAPFSGTTDAPDASLRVALRYVLAPFLMGLALFARVLDHPRLGPPAWAAAVLAALSAWPEEGSLQAATVMAMGLAALAGAWMHRRFLPRVRPLQLGAVALLAGLALLQPWLQSQADRQVFSYVNRGNQRHVAHPWQVLDSLPAGSRVAWFDKCYYEYYPLFGRRFQLTPVIVDEFGCPLPSFLSRWRREAGTLEWWDRRTTPPPAELTALADNLRRAAIEYALVTASDGCWPPQQEALAKALPPSCVVYQDDNAVLYRLQPPSATGPAMVVPAPAVCREGYLDRPEACTFALWPQTARTCMTQSSSHILYVCRNAPPVQEPQ